MSTKSAGSDNTKPHAKGRSAKITPDITVLDTKTTASDTTDSDGKKKWSLLKKDSAVPQNQAHIELLSRRVASELSRETHFTVQELKRLHAYFSTSVRHHFGGSVGLELKEFQSLFRTPPEITERIFCAIHTPNPEKALFEYHDYARLFSVASNRATPTEKLKLIHSILFREGKANPESLQNILSLAFTSMLNASAKIKAVSVISSALNDSNSTTHTNNGLASGQECSAIPSSAVTTTSNPEPPESIISSSIERIVHITFEATDRDGDGLLSWPEFESQASQSTIIGNYTFMRERHLNYLLSKDLPKNYAGDGLNKDNTIFCCSIL